MLKKFDSEASTGNSMRNTTRFNVISKANSGNNELAKKASEEEEKATLSSTVKHSKSQAFISKLMKE